MYLQKTSILLACGRSYHHEKKYVHGDKSKAISRTIDYVFVNDKLFDSMISCDLIDVPLTDNRAVCLNTHNTFDLTGNTMSHLIGNSIMVF